ncbi:unnamed protein product, partial [marine sediment metagenome]
TLIDVEGALTLAGAPALHPTDGITVFQTGDLMNENTKIYYYWAIAE